MVGNVNCGDPKSLFEKALQQPQEFVHQVQIKAFDAEKVEFLNSNDSFGSLWKPMDFVYDPINFGSSEPISTLCYELSVPKSLQSQGVQG